MKQDLELQKFYINYVKAHRKLAPSTYAGMTDANIVSYLRKLLSTHEIEKLYIKEKLIGFCLYYIAKVPYSKEKNFYISDFAIAPRFKRKGWGSDLMKIMTAMAVENKCKNIILSVHHNNPAREFYNKLDFFEEIHIMRKKLDFS